MKPRKFFLAQSPMGEVRQIALHVLNGLTIMAIGELIEWYCSEPRLAFNKTVVTRYRIFLEQAHYASSTINFNGPPLDG